MKNKKMLIAFLVVTAIILAVTFVVPTITPFGVIASAATVVGAYVQLFKLLRAERRAEAKKEA